jgi:hypothetical protein
MSSMKIFIHTYAINKTYILVSYLSFGDNVEETKSVLDGRTWDMTFFYLVTLSLIFILGIIIRFIFTN